MIYIYSQWSTLMWVFFHFVAYLMNYVCMYLCMYLSILLNVEFYLLVLSKKTLLGYFKSLGDSALLFSMTDKSHKVFHAALFFCPPKWYALCVYIFLLKLVSLKIDSILYYFKPGEDIDPKFNVIYCHLHSTFKSFL